MASKILIASDHGGTRLKSTLLSYLGESGFEVVDLGPEDNGASVDYPDYAAKLANAMHEEEYVGILICGSGIGMSIAINRYDWIRAALVHDETSSRLSREHNNANVIVLGERLIGELTAISCLQIFLDTEFAHGRHEKRVEKLEQSQILLTQQESLDAPR